MNDSKPTPDSTGNPARASLARMLELTRGEEIDCEGFAEHLAALVEGNVERPGGNFDVERDQCGSGTRRPHAHARQ